ncbi:hypothetical protein [Corynebacterium casei]|uniref:hypothetical protein n=1 Tax=Corynebacterium casei TaxID=160386 RepID=UPI00186817D0|nr:hypothetical protein [Corynebacterium casei]
MSTTSHRVRADCFESKRARDAPRVPERCPLPGAFSNERNGEGLQVQEREHEAGRERATRVALARWLELERDEPTNEVEGDGS